MSLAHPAARFEFQLAPGVVLTRAGGTVAARTAAGCLLLPPVAPEAADALAGLNAGHVSAGALHRRLGDPGARQVSYALQVLAENQLLRLGVFRGGEPLAEVHPTSPYFRMDDAALDADTAYALSRFCYLRPVGGRLLLESPLSHAQIWLAPGGPVALLGRLAAPARVGKLAGAAEGLSAEEARALLALLVAARFAGAADAAGVVQTDGGDTLRQWDFHDLLFHSRSRNGRHNNPAGGSFRFRGQLPPCPATKRLAGAGLPLPRPDLQALLRHDMPLTRALEGRASVRRYGRAPLTVAELGEFLYRVGRVKGQYDFEGVAYTRRPYPSGGASYELELYPLVRVCQGLPSGLYHYDPAGHALFALSGPTPATDRLLFDAWTACARSVCPEVLLVLAARFQRVSWKYESIAYATVLKNVGVLYQTMYLVATAMGLAPCALGCGNSDLFALATGEDYYEETSVGEFMLGNTRF